MIIPQKPTTLHIGEIDDFIRSEEFKNKAKEMASMLYEKTDECVKIRSIITNYSSFYAILWKLNQIFEDVWSELGYDWDGFLDWVEKNHAPFLKKQHQERDHSKLSIRRYITDLMNFVLDWPLIERRKILKICETSKLKNGQKYCLAFHPSPKYVDFQLMGGVSLKDLKTHTNAVGGAWGEDTWAALVKDNCDAIIDDTEEEGKGLEDTKAKRALLIPMIVFTSSHIIRVSGLTGQTEDYKKFGVDEETPSGVLDVRNSTQASGSSLNLVLSDVSSIQAPEVEQHGPDDNDIIFDELQPPEDDDFLVESSEDLDDDATLEEATEIRSEEEHNDSNDDNEGISFLTHPKLTEDSKRDDTRDITVLEKGDKTFFVCQCGYSSGSKSGAQRHKCREVSDVSYACNVCGQVCKNPGSLKRHTNSKHGKESLSGQFYLLTLIDLFHVHLLYFVYHLNGTFILATTSNSTSSTIASSTENETTCQLCDKVLSTKYNLARHLTRVHAQV